MDGDLTDKVSVDGSVNTYSADTYTLTYKVQDNYGNEATATRTVTVEPVRQADTGNPSGKIVYLTFDDGPGEYTSKLLDILSKYNVKATFFTVGSGHPDLLKAEADAGHSIGIHSATHDYSKIYASEDAFLPIYANSRIPLKMPPASGQPLSVFPAEVPIPSAKATAPVL